MKGGATWAGWNGAARGSARQNAEAWVTENCEPGDRIAAYTRGRAVERLPYAGCRARRRDWRRAYGR